MKQSTHSNAATATQSKGKEKFILLLIGLVGAAGLVFVLNANSGKSAFSQNVSAGAGVELVAN